MQNNHITYPMVFDEGSKTASQIGHVYESAVLERQVVADVLRQAEDVPSRRA